MSAHNEVIKSLMVMAELYGRTMSEAAAQMFLAELNTYRTEDLLHALKQCRRELGRFPTIADVITRVEALDGRPGVEAAWAMLPKDEDKSVVWTTEMATAFGIAWPLIREGDLVAARMAFKERYEAEVKAARTAKKSPVWIPTLGFEPSGRQAALEEATRLNRLPAPQARAVIGEKPVPSEGVKALVAKITKSISGEA